jgi:uncharacterized cysteine cluster protein YcgN (CxxCxxCC family)
MTEDLCEKCGRCCELKERVGEFYKLTGKYCSHFVRTQNEKGYCDIYDNRTGSKLSSGNVCVDSEMAISYGDLPPNCPYAQRVKGYKTRVLDWMVNL